MRHALMRHAPMYQAPMYRALFPAILIALGTLTGCGTRGSLTLPPGPAPAPVLGSAEGVAPPSPDAAASLPDSLPAATGAARRRS
jgi:predicted small lipoprotein YifL